MNQQQRESQAASLVEAAGNAAGKMLVSAKYRLEDPERFCCFPETALILGRKWHIYFYTLMTGYEPEPQSKQLLMLFVLMQIAFNHRESNDWRLPES